MDSLEKMFETKSEIPQIPENERLKLSDFSNTSTVSSEETEKTIENTN